ncbi:MAG TPA: DUF2339 domain-containing protein [Thermoanaerobaculia bacterium]|nr:DUF2339 domain-containing protein [Thermoanaerobaculia bacterium]
MLELLASFAAFAALGLAAWLRERVVRLENEVAALRARENDLSAPSHAAGPASSPAMPQQAAAVDFSSKVNGAVGQAAAAARATDAGTADAPPVAFPAPPIAFAPPPITPSKKNADADASVEAHEPGVSMREGGRESSVAPPPAARMDWESFVGVKLFSWIAGIFLTIGAILFLRYSIDHGWLSEPVQMAIGIAAGAGLLLVCELRPARRYAVTANALDAAGLAILFATLFAAHARWGILGPVSAFVSLAAVAALAVTLAVRHDSTFIALLGLLGGFATPALLGTAEDRPLALFSYLLLLNAGLAWAAARRGWALLPAASLALTGLYGLSVAVKPDDGTLWPVLFPFLGLLAAGLFVFAVFRKQPSLHVLSGLATLAVLGAWFVRSLTPDLLVPGLTAAAGLSLFYFFAPALGARLAPPDPLPPGAAGLGLLGHVLLLTIAAQKSLVVPPDVPETLTLLGLTAAATLAARRAGAAWVNAAGLAAGLFAVFLFTFTAPRAPWPLAALACAGLLALGGVAAWVFDGTLAFGRAAAVGLVGAQSVAIAVSLAPGSPRLDAVLAAHVLFLVALFAVAAGAPEPRLSVLAAGPAILAAYAWGSDGRRPGATWQEEVLFAGVLCALFVLHPLVLGRRVLRARAPYLAAVAACAGLFPILRGALEDGGYRPVIGLLPLALALGMAALLARLLTLGIPPGEDRSRLALVGGAALAFVTVAIPLQFEREWLTLGWALLGAALAWLYGRIPHRGLVVWSLALFAAAFARLALNPAVLTYHARAATPVFNWYLWVYAVAAAAFFAGAALLRRAPAAPWPALVRLLPAGGLALLFVLLNLEIADLFAEGRRLTVNPFSSSLAEGLAYTLGWALFAIVLLVAGIARKSRAVRAAALALLVVTILKCFLFDLARLGGLYRVGSFVGLAVCLACVALLLQRFVLRRDEAGVSIPAPGSSG